MRRELSLKPMPLLNANIQQALRESGLSPGDKDKTAQQALKDARLGLEETLGIVSDIMYTSGNDALRLRAAEDVLKAHGLMKDQTTPVPSVIININDPAAAGKPNPILFPRGFTPKEAS